jgi:hypothetical protein
LTTYDQARQFGKTYVGALNTSPEAFAALFDPDAAVIVRGSRAVPDAVLEVTPPGRSGFRGSRMDGEGFVMTVRVRERESVDDQEHRAALGADGRIVSLAV